MLLSAVLIACNEEKKIQSCLDSLQFADEIIVVDSGSHDRTPEIARKSGARVFTRMLDNFAAQRNYALSLAEGEWILFVDADERVSLELRLEIEKTIRDPQASDGYTLSRINHVFGGPLFYGASGRDHPARLVRRGKGQWEGLVHERLCIQGRQGALQRQFYHVTTQTLSEYFAKFNLYTTLDAQEMIRKGRAKPSWPVILIRPWAEFFYYYILKLGFRDGARGFIYQALSSFYVFVKCLKVRELLQQKDVQKPESDVI